MADSQYTVFGGTLYPDSTSYRCDVVQNLIRVYYKEYAFALHDKDVYGEDDAKKWYSRHDTDFPHKFGEVKKPHIHWLIRTGSTTVNAVANRLGLSVNDVEFFTAPKNSGRVDLFKREFRYLIHLGYPDKYQYTANVIETNLSDADKYKLLEDKETSSQLFFELINIICEEGFTSELQLVRWLEKNQKYFNIAFARRSWISLQLQQNYMEQVRDLDDNSNYSPAVPFDPFPGQFVAQYGEQLKMK